MQQPDHHARNSQDFEIRHRNPLARDFVIISRVVLLGYQQLSDSAKLTYWVVYSHDWYDPVSGARKGYAFPTIRRLCQLRGKAERTLQNHLTELIEVGLLTREFRPGKPSILYVEEPSAEEASRYLENQGVQKSAPPVVQKIAPHKQEEDETEKAVNGVEERVMDAKPSRPGGMASIGTLLDARRLKTTAEPGRAEWLAQQMAEAANDHASMACYMKIARGCPESLVFQALSLLKEAKRDGTGLRSKGGFLVATVRRLCHELGLPDPLPQGQLKGRQDAGSSAAQAVRTEADGGNREQGALQQSVLPASPRSPTRVQD